MSYQEQNRSGIWVRGGGIQHQSFLNQLIIDLMREDLLPPFFMHGAHDQTRSSQLHSEAVVRPGGIAQLLAAVLIEVAVSRETELRGDRSPQIYNRLKYCERNQYLGNKWGYTGEPSG